MPRQSTVCMISISFTFVCCNGGSSADTNPIERTNQERKPSPCDVDRDHGGKERGNRRAARLVPETSEYPIERSDPNDVVKIEDPERHSRECISNGLVGCHMEDVLRQHSEEFIQKKKQIIVLTSAGKPVYCYGRNEEDLTSTVYFRVLN